MNHNKEKNQSIERAPDVTWVINLDNEIKAVIILICHMFKELQERLEMLNRNMDIKKTQTTYKLFRDENYNV